MSEKLFNLMHVLRTAVTEGEQVLMDEKAIELLVKHVDELVSTSEIMQATFMQQVNYGASALSAEAIGAMNDWQLALKKWESPL